MLLGLPLSSREVMAEGLRSPQAGKQPLRVPSHPMDKGGCLNLKICSRALGNAGGYPKRGGCGHELECGRTGEMHSFAGSWKGSHHLSSEKGMLMEEQFH